MKDPFYRGYLWFISMETELLFFMVCDVTFLTQVKGLTSAQVSQVTFLSLLVSLVILVPLLKFINRFGNRISVRLGSTLFLLSSVLITFSPNFYTVLAGGFLKSIALTLNAMGPAILKNHLTRNQTEDQFVSFQSDANSSASFVMMITSLLCGMLFKMNAYYPMYACIALCLTGVIASFRISRRETAANEIHLPEKKRKEDGKMFGITSNMIMMFVSFALFTALTGTGRTYSRMNIQELLSGRGNDYVVSLLSMVSALAYFLKVVANILMKTAYSRVRDKAAMIVSVL